MRINHNIAALNAWGRLTATDSALSKSLEKLSSGLRINRAGDDAAGLAISEKMRAQIKGLDMASKNAQDGISLIQTAEGSLAETHSIVQRMRELAVQASNDTNGSTDRAELQKEIDQLITEIDRIGNTTEFNGKTLLDGGAGIQGNVTGTDKVIILGGSEDVVVGNTLQVDDVTAAAKGTITFEARVTADGTDAALSGFAAASFSINGVSISVSATDTAATFLTKINSVSSSTNVTATGDLANGFTFTTEGVGSGAKADISGFNTVVTMAGTNELRASKNSAALADSTGTESITGKDASVTIDAAATTDVDPTGYTSSGNIVTFVGGEYDGLQIKVDAAASNIDDVNINITANNSLTMHIGANQGQSMAVGINDMRARALGINAIDVTSKANAETAIDTIDDAVGLISAERSRLGAYQNRLEHTINNLGTASENLSAAESRIRDVDMAAEMMEFTKKNILAQAGTAMLAQANQRPQSVLQLLQ